MTSPLSSAGFLLSSHNSRTAAVGNQDLAVKHRRQVTVEQTVLTYIDHLLDLIRESWERDSENGETFVCGVDVSDVDLELLIRDGLQHLLPRQLLSFFHILFALLLKVQSEPVEGMDRFVSN